MEEDGQSVLRASRSRLIPEDVWEEWAAPMGGVCDAADPAASGDLLLLLLQAERDAIIVTHTKLERNVIETSSSKSARHPDGGRR